MVQDSAASFKFDFLLLCFLPTTPVFVTGLDWSHFARRYSGNRFCFLLLWLLRCFNSPGFLYQSYEF